MASYVALALLLCSISYVQSNSYFVMAPKYIRSGYPYNMTVQFESSSTVEVVVAISIEYKSYYTYQMPNETVPPVLLQTFYVEGGDTRKIDMIMPDLEQLSYQKQYTLTVNASSSDFTPISHTSELQYADKNMTIYIQTDKAKYKPGDLVRFRTFAVTASLKTIKAPVDVFIYDSMNNKVEQWLGVSTESGLFSEELQLSAQPNMGNWKIEIQQMGMKKTKYIQVEEYVLPKFEVTVATTPRPYGLLTDDGLRAKVTAKYTFGQPVKGFAQIQIYLHQYYGCYSPTTTYRYSSRPDCKIMNITRELEDGDANIFISMEELIAMIPPSTYAPEGYTGPDIDDLNYKTFMIDVNVTETLTDIVLGSSATINYRRPSIQLTFMGNTPSTYKPGLTYRGYIQLKSIDGSPIEPVHLTTASGGDKFVNISATFNCPPQYNHYPNPYPREPLPPSSSTGIQGPAGTPGSSVSTGSGSAPGMPSTGGASGPSSTQPTTTTGTPACVPYVWSRTIAVDNLAGVVVFELETPQNYEQMSLQATYVSYYEEEIKGYKSISKFETENNNVIQLSTELEDGAVMPDTSVDFTITTTEPITAFSYYVMGKGNLVMSKMMSEIEPFTTYQFRVYVDTALAQTLAPTMTVIVTCRTGDNELIADSASINVEGAMVNQVGVAFDIDGLTNMSRPGDEVDVQLTASANSLLGLLVVDQSVLLLQSGNDVTTEMVMSDLAQYAPGQYFNIMPLARGMVDKRKKRSTWMCWWCYPYYGGGSDVGSLLDSAKVIVFTDAKMYEVEPAYSNYPGVRGERGPDGPGVPAGPSGPQGQAGWRGEFGSPGDDSNALQPVDSIRQEFPETWIWQEDVVGPEGRSVVKATVPDTITSWVASAFALNDVDGLGIAEQAKLTTFKPFFVTLSLPYSVVRGEEFLLKALVFNYLAEKQNVTVTLDYSEEFMVLTNNERVHQTVTKKIEVPANDALTALFWIIPTKIGTIDLIVKAQSSQAADALKRPLIVEAEGTPDQYASSVFIHLTQDNNNSPYIRKLDIELPETGLVPGSEYIKVTAIGDIMGSTANNLDRLVKMPSGCGEQNMINFAPNIYVMKYLTAAQLLTSQIETQALSFMKSGYQRELTYKRTDGSYSAFGNYDDSGSTWLTAFVIKCYVQAMPFITIDTDKIKDSLGFLTKNQLPDGSFNEPGRVIHGDLTGGSGSGIGLAAYVLLTLVENQNLTNVSEPIRKAVTYLEDQVDDIEDAYTLAITTYALKRAGSAQTATLLNRLDELAIDESGYRHWAENPDRSSEVEDLPPWQRYSQTASLDIEMTAYALLAYVEFGNMEAALPIVKWLASKQSGSGAFRSTQDTVVGLNALAEFAMLTIMTTGGQQNVELDVNIDNDHYTFDTLTSQNKVVLQSIETPNSAKKVVLKGYGVGTAVVQLIIQYNMEEVDDSPSINLDVDVTGAGTALILNICAEWINEGTDSGMSIISIQGMSGHVFDTTPLMDAYGPLGLKKVEMSGKSLNLYFDEIPSGDDLCVTVVQYKAEEVANLQSATVSAYSYYSPDKIQKVFYSAEGEVVNPCLACIECCQVIDVALSDDGDKYDFDDNNNYPGAATTMTTSIFLMLITLLLHLV